MKKLNRRDSKSQHSKTEFRWEFSPNGGLSDDEPHYDEFLKRNFTYDAKLYDTNREWFRSPQREEEIGN